MLLSSSGMLQGKRLQGNCGPWKELTAAGRKMTCCAGVAQRKRHRRKGQNKDSVAPRSPKGQTWGRERCARNATVA
jgi:hypothetical protein